jgi:predicted component of type VI protein secretion system
MSKTFAQLDAEIAEALRAKEWQDRIEREELARRERMAPRIGPTPEQLYNERAADRAAGVFHGERRGRARDFRKT